MKTIKRSSLSVIAMVHGGERKVKQVIMDDNVMTWVGIGWINEGKPTKAQQLALPKVVDE